MPNYITINDASSLIPIEASAEILQNIPRESVAMKLMRRLPDMNSRQTRLPVLNAMATAGFVNGEIGPAPVDRYAWDNVMLNAEEIAIIIPISRSVLEDSEYDIWSAVKPQIAAEFARVFDAAALFGAGKPDTWPDGLVPAAVAADHLKLLGSDLVKDINNTFAMVEQDGYEVNGICATPSVKAMLRGLYDSTGRPIYNPSLTANTPSDIYGVPMRYLGGGTGAGDNKLMLCGDFTHAVYSIRQDITYKILDQAVITNSDNTVAFNLAQQDMLALRVVMRVAWAVENPVNRVNEGAGGRFPFAVLSEEDLSEEEEEL